MKKLYNRWGQQVHFVDVMVRQAHPGPGAPTYKSFEDKLRDAQSFQREEGLPWAVLVDDLEGTVHQVYGTLADPAYLIDTDGRVSYYNMWTYVPALHQAIEAVLGQGGRGVVEGGMRRTPNLGPTLTDGWNGLRRGWPQSFFEMELATPGSASGAWLGHQLRPLLAPLTLRAEPLPSSTKAALAVGAVATILGVRWLIRR